MDEGQDGRARGNGRPLLHRAFISPDEPRLRAGWRLAVHALLTALAGLALSVLAALAGAGRIVGAGTPWELAYASLPVALAVTAASWVARRYVDHRSFSSLGLTISARAWRDLGLGLLLGAGMVGLVFAALAALGWLSVVGWAGATVPTNALASDVLGAVALFVLVGYYEELLSRGYHLSNLAEGLSCGWAVALTSVSFPLFHLGNPTAGAASVMGLLAAGVFLAYARLRTGLLWMPIGVHIAWNLALGLLGFPVSGIAVFSLLTLRVTGPELATGGAFGPEAGALAPLSLLLGAIIVRAYTRNRTVSSSV